MASNTKKISAYCDTVNGEKRRGEKRASKLSLRSRAIHRAQLRRNEIRQIKLILSFKKMVRTLH